MRPSQRTQSTTSGQTATSRNGSRRLRSFIKRTAFGARASDAPTGRRAVCAFEDLDIYVLSAESDSRCQTADSGSYDDDLHADETIEKPGDLSFAPAAKLRCRYTAL